MQLISFKTAVISRTVEGELILALMDGNGSPEGGACVGLISCDPETAEAMCAGVGSVLKAKDEQ